MYINTNEYSLRIQYALRVNNESVEQNVEHLSTGQRVNSGKDGGAQLAIVTRLQKQLNGNEISKQNIVDGLSYLQIGESGLANIQLNLQKIRDILVQSDSNVLGQADKASLQQQMDDYLKGIDQIANATNFNNMFMLKGGAGPQIHDGYNGKDTYHLTSVDATTTGLGIGGLDLSDPPGSIKKIDDIMDTLSKKRADFGINEEVLQKVRDKLDVGDVKTEAAKGRIQDADFAVEVSQLTKNKILDRTATSMLYQVNDQRDAIAELLKS